MVYGQTSPPSANTIFLYLNSSQHSLRKTCAIDEKKGKYKEIFTKKKNKYSCLENLNHILMLTATARQKLFQDSYKNEILKTATKGKTFCTHCQSEASISIKQNNICQKTVLTKKKN